MFIYIIYFMYVFRGGIFIKIFVELASKHKKKTQIIEKYTEKESQRNFIIIEMHRRIIFLQ